MFRNFTNLEELSLGAVNISSVLPTTLNISSSLKLLNLRLTRLQGKLPHSIFNLRSLEILDLSDNSFTGNIPSKISVNLTHLTSLRLSSNNLNGTLTSWLFTSPSLESLDLSYNMFSGNVPLESFRQLTNLTDMYLSFNNFSGEWELDTLLSSLTNLESLYLSYSGFSVTTNNANHYVNPGFRDLELASCHLKVFPKSFRAMKQLRSLDLSSNEIDGQIPHWEGEIGGTYGLGYVNLSHNFITALPQFQWYGLAYLFLQSNLIEGPFPPSICNMSTLYYLDMSHNFITALPQFQWYGLAYLFLQSNLIEGPFPPSICNMSTLYYLDMSNNRFGGLIPECFGKLTASLEMIDMGNNSFQGTIPNVYGDCGSLEGLSLNGNQLRGEVPSFLSNCSDLSVLDLGNNHLTGTFPSWLGDLSNLEALVLKSNNFHGHIQPSSTVESPFPSLRVLDLSHNGFVGQLPAKYFESFNSMKNVAKNEPQLESDAESGVTWEVVMLRYGCGTILGLVMGYLMLSTRKVKWFNAIADAGESLAEEFEEGWDLLNYAIEERGDVGTWMWNHNWIGDRLSHVINHKTKLAKCNC
ncbi:Leucine-rich repeat-containing protein [Artemisia annua]|uniref:Leucine-rich repeat-containing protein n=1 Tax=Artemisia annua TaxID=35608 RepID=A0A2U1MM72_ARTAN|nr:Leucine-rich repeat-containing protein [Artemisia annua]